MGEAMIGDLDVVLDSELRYALSRQDAMAVMRNILVKYRDRGFGQKSVYELLNSMRKDADEDLEDRILELMDIASGFCSPHMRVW